MDVSKLYKTQWKAYYKHGLRGPKIVYGESEDEAVRMALAEYRRNCTTIDWQPIKDVVDKVEFIG